MPAKKFAVALSLVLLTISATVWAESASSPPVMSEKSVIAAKDIPVGMAKIGAPAPSFTLTGVVDKVFKKIGLSDYRKKWVVLFFYPNDFSKVCPTEIKGFNASVDSFRKLNTEILGVSTDSKFSHLAWVQRGDLGELKYPLLADFTKETTFKYGVLDQAEGTAFRGLFIIDPQGVLQYMTIHNRDVGRSVEETLRVLEALQTGSLCPLDWKPGQKTINK